MRAFLFSASETTFTTNGLGSLQDAQIKVTEKLNGEYTLDMIYPASGVQFDNIVPGNYVLTTVNPSGSMQAFRISKTIRRSDQKVEVQGNHISYELNGIPIEPFNAQGITATFNGFGTHAMITNPFTYWTDKTNTTSTYYQIIPQSARACLGGVEGSVLDVFGGEYEFDNYTVKLWNRRGADNGVTILYGKNLISLAQEKEIESVYTGVVSYWIQDDAVSTGQVQYISNYQNYPKQRVLVVDASNDFETQPSLGQLNTYSQNYITAHNVGTPKINLEVSYIDLSQTDNYKGQVPLQPISMGDTVGVYFDRLGVSVSARVIETTWNANKERYDSIVIGSVKSSLARTIYDATAEMESIVKTASRIVSVVQRIDREVGSISATVSQVTETLDGVIVDVSNVTQTAEQISQTVTRIDGDYVTQSAFNQNADNVQFQFSQVQDAVDTNTEGLATLQTVITLDNNGVTVGKNDSDIRGVFGNSSLDFIDSSDTKLAWLSTEDGLGATEISIGDATTKNKRWRLIVSSDGSHFRITRHT